MIRRRRSSDSNVNHDRWLVSYADFITLMFAFFVVLYASSQADKKKQIQVSESIDTAFQSLGLFQSSSRNPKDHHKSFSGKDAAAIPMNIVMGEDVLAPAKVKEDLERTKRQMEQLLSDKIADHTVSIKMGRDGLVISLREAGFFNSGSATPQPDTLPTLRQVATALGRTPYDLRVEGHTDNLPIHTAEFDSNWELSSARATQIARMFLNIGAISPDKLSAAGYAEFHPVAPNDAPDGRAQNRRVDLVILPRSKINFSSSSLAASNGLGHWRRITDAE